MSRTQPPSRVFCDLYWDIVIDDIDVGDLPVGVDIT